jgi:Lrp/AsnC family transcriptional regulator for asnA, asnC and gidA
LHNVVHKMSSLDALDRKFIFLLQKKGRMSFSDLARTLKISEATVRRRVERLLTEGVMEIVACIEPRQVGLEFEAMICLQVDLDKLTQIGQRLAAMPEVREVVYTSGAYDMVVRLALPGSGDLLPFLTQQIAVIPGIKDIQTAHVLQTEKRMSAWQLPEKVKEKEPVAPGALVLIVDDDPDFVAAATMVLEARGYRVATAAGVEPALRWLQDQRPDLVLLDLMMETPLAGLQVARAIRERPQLQHVPVLVVSAIWASEWAGKLPPTEDLPVDDFVDKPIEPGVLLDKIARLIG